MSGGSLLKATRQLPCSVVILTTKYGDERDAMTASAMFVSEEPSLLVVSVSKTFKTCELIEKSHEFVVNVLADDELDLAHKLGRSHGKNTDKLASFKVPTEPANKVGAPLISDCFANIECKVKTSIWDVEGGHAIYLAEVLACKTNAKLKPLVWLNGKYYHLGSECRN
jgi:flavin reductase (DIM6/NTAB) family NADH-FMN oxidoreductase RutF